MKGGARTTTGIRRATKRRVKGRLWESDQQVQSGAKNDLIFASISYATVLSLFERGGGCARGNN